MGQNTVLTNAHVVEGMSSVSLHTALGTKRARVATVATDYDLAVLKIDGAAEHAVLPLAALPSARVGQEVIAIGFALGLLENTVTRGIISGIRRVGGITFLQTDAAINPGNSGGPLLDTSGRVLGVTTLKFGAQAESLGFAVSAEHAGPLLTGGRPPARAAIASRDSSDSRRLAPILTPNQTSAAGRLRAEGAQAYEQQVAALAQQANQIDAFWDQFQDDLPRRTATPTLRPALVQPVRWDRSHRPGWAAVRLLARRSVTGVGRHRQRHAGGGRSRSTGRRLSGRAA